MYDDDGHTLGYQNGTDERENWIRFDWNDATRRLTIAPGPQMKRWPVGAKRVFDVQLMSTQPRTTRVEFQGERTESDFQ
jgi:hypothetical protein